MASNRTIELLIVISAKLIMVQLTTRGETSTFSLGGGGGGGGCSANLPCEIL